MYISSGEMGIYDGSSTRTVPSQRAQQYIRTLRQLEKQHAWKIEGEGARFMHQRNPYANAAEYSQSRITGFAPYRDGILYSIALSGAAGSLHTKNPLDDNEPEGLVTSAASFQTRDMVFSGDSLYFSLQDREGCHITRMNPENGRYEPLTEGDTIERHPFIDSSGSIYFDMCGFARDTERRIIGYGPSAIAEMTPRGEIREIYADSDTNYLKYTKTAGGIQRMMARPYKTSSGSSPLGCLMAPFEAVAGFIHMFSAINAARKGKEAPLDHSGSEAARRMDEKISIDGVSIDLKQLQREQKRYPDEYSSLVPRDWKLLSVQSDGSLITLQHGVLDYLPLDDGAYLYSNGRHVFHVDNDGNRRMLFKAHLATDLAVLHPST